MLVECFYILEKNGNQAVQGVPQNIECYGIEQLNHYVIFFEETLLLLCTLYICFGIGWNDSGKLNPDFEDFLQPPGYNKLSH